MRILVVEDEALIRMLICDFLEDAGHECHCAVDGEQALALLDSHLVHPDILVTDYNLGSGLNGMALAQEIQNRNPGLPTVFVTANADCFSSYPFQAWEALVAKPFRGQNLVAVIERLNSVGRGMAGIKAGIGTSLFRAVTGRPGTRYSDLGAIAHGAANTSL